MIDESVGPDALPEGNTRRAFIPIPAMAETGTGSETEPKIDKEVVVALTNFSPAGRCAAIQAKPTVPSSLTTEVWYPADNRELTTLISDLSRTLIDRLIEEGYESPELRLRTVLEEAVVNAWTHGNGQDKQKSITLRWGFGDDFYLEVVDQGPGFDYTRPPDPTLAENLCKPCGRGIFIIRHYADGVRWLDNGSRMIITLKKKNSNGF